MLFGGLGKSTLKVDDSVARKVRKKCGWIMAGGQKENVSLLTHSLLEANANFLPLRETRKLLGEFSGNFTRQS